MRVNTGPALIELAPMRRKCFATLTRPTGTGFCFIGNNGGGKGAGSVDEMSYLSRVPQLVGDVVIGNGIGKTFGQEDGAEQVSHVPKPPPRLVLVIVDDHQSLLGR